MPRSKSISSNGSDESNDADGKDVTEHFEYIWFFYQHRIYMIDINLTFIYKIHLKQFLLNSFPKIKILLNHKNRTNRAWDYEEQFSSGAFLIHDLVVSLFSLVNQNSQMSYKWPNTKTKTRLTKIKIFIQ